jgi:peptide/nickel transport system substrate-binding protein
MYLMVAPMSAPSRRTWAPYVDSRQPCVVKWADSMRLYSMLALQKFDATREIFARGLRVRNGGFNLVKMAGNLEESVHYRSMKIVRTSAASFLAIALLVMSGFGVQNLGVAEAAADDYIVYTMGTTLVPDDFNPFEMTTGISYTVSYLMHEFLITTGPVMMEPYPQLAQSWESSEDGLVWTFHLVKDAYWHDDVHVTSADVVFTLEMMMDNPDECALWSSEMSGIIGADALDDYTVEITLESPRSDIEGGLVPILPKHLWENVDPADISSVDLWDPDIFPDGPVGSGPFILEEYRRTEGLIILKAWEKYHMGKVNIDELRIVVYQAPSMITALETGEIDLATGVPPTAWTPLIEQPEIQGQPSPSIDLTEFGVNCASEEIRSSTDDKGARNFPQASDNLETLNLAVRQAMAIAINQTYLVENVMLGLATEGSSLVPPATPYWHWYVPEEEKWSHDLDDARQLLEDAGYIDTNGDGVRENQTNGAELDFIFYYITNSDVDTNAAIQISAWLEEIGIRADPQGVTEGTLYNYWFNMAYDLFIWNWQPGVDPTFILSVLTTGEIPLNSKDKTAWSDAFYSNPEYDQLFEDQQHASNMSARQAIVHEMQRIVYGDCPYVVLWYPSSLNAYRIDRFYNFPDMEEMAGISPHNFWYYYEILPIGYYPPFNVDAGVDREAYVGETLAFSGYAEDANDPVSSLNWTWTFLFEDDSEATEYGNSVNCTFTSIGEVEVTLVVTDPDGLSSSDSLIVTVTEPPEDLAYLEGFVKNPDGVAFVGATVAIESIGRLSLTDTAGHYNLSAEAGTYTVRVTMRGCDNVSETVTLNASRTTWLNITLTSTVGSIALHVVDSVNGNPIEGAEVVVSRGDFTQTIFTNDQGYNQLDNLAVGEYSVLVSADGFQDESTTAEVLVNEVTQVTVTLELSDEGGVGAGVFGIAAGVVLVIVIVAAALLMLRRKQSPKDPHQMGDSNLPDE